MTRKPEKHPERRAPTDHDASGDTKDAEWGFEADDEERLLEPRLGVALVMCLVLAFGFVLYQKYQSIDEKPRQTVVENRIEEDPAQRDAELAGDEPTPASSPNESAELFSPFEQSEQSPALTAGNSASAEPSDVSGNVNPFAVTAEADEQAGDYSAPPPQQGEPTPVDGLSEWSEPEPTSINAAQSDPVVDDEPLVQQTEPRGSAGTAATAADGSAHRSAPPDWSLDEEPQLSDGAQASPDPFAPSTEMPDDAHGVESQVHGQEPPPLDSTEVALPMPPEQQQPDPFLAEEPHPSASHVKSEPHPFGDVAGSPEVAPAPETESLEWSFSDAPPQEEVTDSQQSLRAPELPDLPENSEQDFAAGDSPWELGPASQSVSAPSSTQQPGLGFSPSPGSDNLPSTHSMSNSALQVVGEREVTVTRNDTLWSISQDAYGTARYVPALARHNRDQIPHPDRLPVGVRIRIPPPEVLESRFPELFHRPHHRDAKVAPAGASTSPGHAREFLSSDGRPLYRVGKDDTLSSISAKYLGRASRWTEILNLNRDQLKSPKALKPGMVLRMPADAAESTVDSRTLYSR